MSRDEEHIRLELVANSLVSLASSAEKVVDLLSLLVERLPVKRGPRPKYRVGE